MPHMRSAAPAPESPFAVPASPPATRVRTRRWRDPRLWAGVVLVAGSTMVGGRLLAADPGTIAVWRLTAAAPAGSVVSADHLEHVEVAFGGSDLGTRYVPATDPPPVDAVAAYPLAAGDLLARSALVPASAATPELPLAVQAGDLPADLAVGDRVAVWSAPTPGDPDGSVLLVLAGATVRAVSGGPRGDLLAPRQVVVGLPSARVVGQTLRRIGSGRVVLVRVGG